jgi:hypothetical protein
MDDRFNPSGRWNTKEHRDSPGSGIDKMKPTGVGVSNKQGGTNSSQCLVGDTPKQWFDTGDPEDKIAARIPTGPAGGA